MNETLQLVNSIYASKPIRTALDAALQDTDRVMNRSSLWFRFLSLF